MVLLKLQVKFFVTNPEAVDLDAFIGIFHHWIQKKSVPGLLIDVADYKHVPQGPGIMLIGHEGDYSLDMSRGLPGLMYARKRRVDASLQEQIQQSFQAALKAIELIEAETPLRFQRDEVEVRFADRLVIPNRPESLDIVRPDLEAALGSLLQVSITSHDSREIFTVRMQLAQVLA